MKERAVEVIFKHKVLILLPIITIMPLMIMMAAQPRQEVWQSFVVIWIDQYKPLYSDDRLGFTPAGNQAQLLNDFIRTRTFALDVLSRTQRASQLDSPRSELVEADRFWKSVQAWPSSNNFITIGVNAENPELAYELASAVVASFQETLGAYLKQQSEISAALYAGAVSEAEKSLNQVRAELASYVASRPDLGSARTDLSLPLESRDATYARLLSQVNIQQERYVSLLRRYEDLQTTARAGATSQEFAFTVIDEPQRPIAPVPQSRFGPLKFPVIGFTMAMILSTAVALFFIFTNRAVLGGRDLRRMVDVPVLGELPELRRRRWFWQRGPRHAVRQRLTKPAGLASVSSDPITGRAA